MTYPNPKIVVLGAGFAGLEAAFLLRQRLGRSAQISVVAESDTFLFKPNTIYVPFGKAAEKYVIPLSEPFERRHIEFIQGTVEGVDPGQKKVKTSAGDVDYDYLMIGTGAGMRPNEVPGLGDHGDQIWNLDGMVELRASLEKMMLHARAGTRQRVLFLVPPNNKCSGRLIARVRDSRPATAAHDRRSRSWGASKSIIGPSGT